MPRQEVMKDIPDSEVEQAEQDAKDSGATNVEKTRQPDGNWTLTLTFADSD